MNILYLSQYFPPEIGATQTRAYEMASNLVKSGHRVTVMTEIPNHPLGIIFEGYRSSLKSIEYMDGIEVIRSWVYTNPIKKFYSRMLFYTSYMVTTVLNSLTLKNNYDLIFATSPPLFVGLAGLIISKIKKAPFVLEVRDLWPESAVVLGELNNPHLVKASSSIAELLYKRAEKIIAVTTGIYRYLLNKNYISREKVHFIPNGANTDLYKPGKKDAQLLQTLGIDTSQFLVLYAGIHGLIHGLEAVIRAAHILKDKRISFVFIGDGVKKKDIMRLAKSYLLKNVTFINSVPENLLPRYIQSCDAGIATTIKSELCKGTLPVKMFSYMACAKPVILGVDGEARQVIEKAKAGIYAEPEDPEDMAKAILTLKDNPRLCREMGKNGRRYVEKHYSRERLAKKLEQCLLDVIKV
ncbi:MAG: glycosyltransferase WbuB [Deltaproteobacteria bacterium]|nr:MAG: glycosyltransferase WbuB [Deltaproteobacteria bacterium]